MNDIFNEKDFQAVKIDEQACLKAIDEMTPDQMRMIGQLLYDDDYQFNWDAFMKAGINEQWHYNNF